MGGHHARAAAPETRRMRRLTLAVVLPLAALSLVAMALMWPRDSVRPPEGSAAAEVDGRVTAIDRVACEQDLPDDVNGCGTATVELTGADEDTAEVPLPNGSGAPEVAVGDEVVVTVGDGPDGTVYSIVDQQRGTGLVVLALAFVLALVAFGRWKGVASLVGLTVTFLVVLYFLIPAILGGRSPLLVAVVASSVIALTVLYVTHGPRLVTTVAVVGTLASLALTGGLAVAATGALHLSGVTDDLAGTVERTYGVDMTGLLVASIIIGSLGVLDDVTVTQAATVDELARADPSYRFPQLYAAGARVGRSHIGSVVNTIVLAYAGSSLPLLLLVVADNPSLGDVVTTQLVAQEIVRSLVATLGLVAAVPITTALAAAAVLAARPRHQGPAPASGLG